MAKYLNLTGLQTLWTKIKAALDGKSPTTHTHTVKINGAEKTIAATGDTAVDLGTYLTAHQDISGKADLANTSQAILSEPSQADGTKYLIVSQTTFGGSSTSAWINCDLSIIIQSRHSGTGLAVIQCNTNTSTPTETSVTGTINIFTTTNGTRISSPLTMYRKYDASTYKWTITVVVKCSDYNNFRIKSVLSKNGLNYSTSCTYVTDLTTLGTQIATAVTASNSNHTHGNITNAGALQTTDIAIANGDKLVVTDSSNSSKVARTSLSFDGSTTTKALTPKGTWESFAKSSEIPAAANNGALQIQLNGGTATSKFTANQSGNSTLAFSTGSTAGTFKVDSTEIAIAGFTKVESSSTNGNIKINGTETTVYTHPTTAGNKHIPSGGSSGQFLGWDSAGTAKWVSNPNSDTKVKATAKSDNVNYKILATASASPTSGNATEAVYDTDISLNPSTNTISANISGNSATATKPKTTTLNTSSNLDDIKGSSLGDFLYYSWTSGNAPTGATLITGSGDAPTATMEVVRTHSGNYCVQTVYTASKGVYQRIYNNGTWGAWYRYAKASTTLSGYGITNAYTKTEVDGLLDEKANKSEMSVTPGTGGNADKTTIQLKSGTSATVLTQHQDITTKLNIEHYDFHPDSTSTIKNWNALIRNAVVNIERSQDVGVNGSPESGNMNALTLLCGSYLSQMAFGNNIYYRERLSSGNFNDWRNVVTSNSIKKIVKDTIIGTDADVLYVLI